MSQPLTPRSQQAVLDRFQDIENLNKLNDPAKSTTEYAAHLVKNPEVDQDVCNAAGKVAFVTVRFKEKLDHAVTIRGTGTSALDWNKDFAASKHEPTNFHERVFVINVPVNQMNNTLSFKFLTYTAENKARWSNGPNAHNPNMNFTMNMSQFGHIAKIVINDVQFQ